MVGVEDEQDVERTGEHRVGLEAGLGDLPHHRQEVRGEREGVVRVDERHAHAEAVGGGGQRGHLGDQADDLLVAGLGVEDVLGVEVEGRERGHGRYEHAHRVGVVVEPLQEALAHVLVDEGVEGDLPFPHLELGLGGELTVEQEVGHLQEGGVLGQLLDGIPPVAEDPGIAVEVGDGALTGGGGRQTRIVEPDAGEQLREVRRRHPAVFQRDLEGLARAVVGDRDALGHSRQTLRSVRILVVHPILDARPPDPDQPDGPGHGATWTRNCWLVPVGSTWPGGSDAVTVSV